MAAAPAAVSYLSVGSMFCCCMSRLSLALTDAATDPARGLDTMAMLRMAPLPGTFSRFYGNTGAGGAPVTLPRAHPAAAAADAASDEDGSSKGMQQLTVGDVATVAVQVLLDARACMVCRYAARSDKTGLMSETHSIGHSTASVIP